MPKFQMLAVIFIDEDGSEKTVDVDGTILFLTSAEYGVRKQAFIATDLAPFGDDPQIIATSTMDPKFPAALDEERHKEMITALVNEEVTFAFIAKPPTPEFSIKAARILESERLARESDDAARRSANLFAGRDEDDDGE